MRNKGNSLTGYFFGILGSTVKARTPMPVVTTVADSVGFSIAQHDSTRPIGSLAGFEGVRVAPIASGIKGPNNSVVDGPWI